MHKVMYFSKVLETDVRKFRTVAYEDLAWDTMFVVVYMHTGNSSLSLQKGTGQLPSDSDCLALVVALVVQQDFLLDISAMLCNWTPYLSHPD